MDDPACDSTWEDSGEEDDGDPSAGGDADGDGAAPGDADEDGEAERKTRLAEPQVQRPSGAEPRTAAAWNWRAMRDTARYRRHYPGLDDKDRNPDELNLRFYRNEISFLPNGCRIEDFLQSWKDDYEQLEDNHSYIQWLFPLREHGVNWKAKPLTLQEIQAFKSSPEIQERLVRAYELMLGFYGIRLEDRSSGRVGRAHNYAERFQNLNRHSHNNLRLTRILKSLGELGLERLQAPLAHFFLEETLVRRELSAVRQSALDYFVFTVRCRRQRRQLLRFAWEHFEPRESFVWAPHDRLKSFPLPGSPPPEARAPAQEDEATDGGSPGSPPSDAGAQERDLGTEAEDAMAAPRSPKESKKRKLEGGREQAPPESDPLVLPDVEKISVTLQSCAIGQDGPGPALGPVGGQDTGEAAQKGTDEVRKRRKVIPATDAPSGSPEHEKDEDGVQEAEGQAGPAQADPVNPAVPEDGAPVNPQEP